MKQSPTNTVVGLSSFAYDVGVNKRLFSEMGLSPEMLKAIDNLGFEQAAPIQSEAIPLIMQGLDIVGQSQTGSGKTAAFAIPAVEKVDPKSRAVQVLILCPTRELAMQVADEVHKLSLFKNNIRSVPIYGGASYDRQLQALHQGVQIVIGTPGRVMDHMRRGTLKLNSTHMVILDEADRMLDMGFREDIELILQSVPKERQLVFFSATLSKPIQDLIRKFAKDPKSVRIDENKAMTVPTVEQVFYEVQRYGKKDALTRIIDLYDIKLAIIFCNTKRMVDELTDDLLAKGYLADRLHGDINQSARTRVMEKFRNSDFDLLIATDVAARGIDVDHVEAVFNYDLPYDCEDYVHRIGRTGRAGRKGKAITFVQGRDIYLLNRIERFTKTKIRRENVPSITAVEEKKVVSFFEKLKKTLEEGKYKKHDTMIDQLLEQGFTSTDISSAVLHHLLGSQSAKSPSSAPKKVPPFPDTFPAERGSRSDSPPRERNFEKRSDDRGRDDKKFRDSRDRSLPRSMPERGMQRLKLNVGRNLGISPGDVVGKILGLTNLPPKIVGAIDIFPEHLFVDVVQEHASIIQTKLSKVDLKGCQLNVEMVDANNFDPAPPRAFRPKERSFSDRPPRRGEYSKRQGDFPKRRRG
jgi:ATP-dependent RNA helicase DeaD